MIFPYLKVKPQGFVISDKDKYFGFNQNVIQDELKRVSFSWQEDFLVAMSYVVAAAGVLCFISTFLLLFIGGDGLLGSGILALFIAIQFVIYIKLNEMNLKANVLNTFLSRSQYIASLSPADPELILKYREQCAVNRGTNNDEDVLAWDAYINARLNQLGLITSFEVQSAIRDLKQKVDTYIVRQSMRDI